MQFTKVSFCLCIVWSVQGAALSENLHNINIVLQESTDYELLFNEFPLVYYRMKMVSAMLAGKTRFAYVGQVTSMLIRKLTWMC